MTRNASWYWVICLCCYGHIAAAQSTLWKGQWLLHESAWFTQEAFCLDSLPKKEGAYLLLVFDEGHRLHLSVPGHVAICESPAVQLDSGAWWLEGNSLLLYLKGKWGDGQGFEYKIQYEWKATPGRRCLNVLRILHAKE
ncbi:MAG: hypothetical protein KatS3mg033_0231 [Thermonema sp.]|uniref:hypothetical protein n=1 Tax=Thermonema TaxID=28194 RepID=UPI0012F732D0|nr:MULTISPECIES: hypothetical protein [Thermonema]GIV38431.1 MAG: hypothetical protein KatS3mg033_0231 [Thermonema sp.]